MSFFVSTTGLISQVLIDDLGGIILNHPVVDYDIDPETSTEEILESEDFREAVRLGYITAKDEYGNVILDETDFDNLTNMNMTSGITFPIDNILISRSSCIPIITVNGNLIERK